MLQYIWKKIGILTGYALFALVAVGPIAYGLLVG